MTLTRKKQFDTTLKSMYELVKQTELTRMLIENKKTDSSDASTYKTISCEEAVQMSSIVLKPNSSQTPTRDQFNEKNVSSLRLNHSG